MLAAAGGIVRGNLMPLLAAVLGIVLLAALAGPREPTLEELIKARGTRRSGLVERSVVNGVPGVAVKAAPQPPGSGFSPQTRLGFTAGDQWEPAIATDRSGHIYILYAQYLGVPGCPECDSPSQALQVSADRGATWSAPRVMFREGASSGGQWDSQIVVDPVDGRTVYAAWLQNGKSDIAVARSDDFGATWHVAIADATNAGTDKPILGVRGADVYVAYNHSQTIWVSHSHDRGSTWASVKAQATGKGKLGWSLAAGGTVTPNGDVHFSWAGYEQSGVAKGPVNLYVSSSRDRGATWTDTLLDVSGSPPDCSIDKCGWAFLGAQAVIASDAAGTLYALWNAGPADEKGAPERIYYARSVDGGRTWSARVEVSTAVAGAPHAFPAIAAGSAGDVRISWMDGRVGNGLWNTYYRSSSNGGSSWSAEVDLSTPVTGFGYITADGFEFPFGDYYELDIDDRSTTHAIFGEALNYDTPGSIWYVRGR